MPTDLVTGSSGLLGHCVVTRLREANRRIRLFDVLPPPPALRGEGIDAMVGDMRDLARVRGAAREVDVIYHLAAGQRMKPQFSTLDEEEIRSMNVTGVANVLAAARQAGVRKVVHISSSGVYGIPTAVPVTEEHPQRPLGAYGVSKIQGETLCQEHLAAGGDVTILRPMSLFGPGMTGVFVLLFDWVHRGKNVYLLGSGRNRVQMISAWDVADACLLAAHTPAARGAVLNLGSGEPPTVREQVEALIHRVGSRSRVVTIPAALLRSAARMLNVFGLSPIVPEHYLLADSTFVLDITRARTLLGWQPRFDNVGLMADAYRWYVEHAAEAAPQRNLVLRLLDLLS